MDLCQDHQVVQGQIIIIDQITQTVQDQVLLIVGQVLQLIQDQIVITTHLDLQTQIVLDQVVTTTHQGQVLQIVLDQVVTTTHQDLHQALQDHLAHQAQAGHQVEVDQDQVEEEDKTILYRGNIFKED